MNKVLYASSVRINSKTIITNDDGDRRGGVDVWMWMWMRVR